MRLLSFLFLFSFLGLYNPSVAQILEQHFDRLGNIEEFQADDPGVGQVDNVDFTMLRSDVDGERGIEPFVLEQKDDGKQLLINKYRRQFRHFIKHSGFDNVPSLVLRFKFSVKSSNDEVQFGGLYIGNGLKEGSFYPDGIKRWAQIGIYTNEERGFFFRNELAKPSPDAATPYNGQTSTYNGEQTVTIIANNSGGVISYNGPDNEQVDLNDQAIDIWIGEDHEIKSAAAFAGAESDISEVKFLTWGNESISSIWLDDLFIDVPGNNPLPVVLTSFTATKSGDDVLLDWETASEKNSSHFEVERSPDGELFEKVGRVSAAGNSHIAQSYSFSDRQAGQKFGGTLYYRLHQVDTDGFSEYSPVRRVELPAPLSGFRRVFPNPFEGELNVGLLTDKSMEVSFRLLNLQGTLIAEDVKITEPAGQEQVYRFGGTDNLQSGMYILEIGSAGEKKRFRIVKL